MEETAEAIASVAWYISSITASSLACPLSHVSLAETAKCTLDEVRVVQRYTDSKRADCRGAKASIAVCALERREEPIASS